MDSGNFTIDGKSSKDFGIILTAPPKEVFAERDVETISIPGRSGDLIVDNGRYKNVTLSYSCAIIPQNGESLRQEIVNAFGFFRRSATYVRVEDSFNPAHYRMAAIVSRCRVESIMEQAGRFDLELNAKPQRFLKSGETALVYSEAGIIVNPTQYASKPLLEITGAGPGTVTAGRQTVQIKTISGSLFVDCDTMNAYNLDGEGIPRNRNADIFAPEFPVFAPGSNPVSWTGGITGVKITPRWWTL